jgi:SSS family solute:Na+ symporter
MLKLGYGPLAVWEIFGQAGHTKVDFFNFDPSVRLTPIGMILSAFFWNICTLGGDQVAVQRFLSTPSLKAARRSIWTYAIWGAVLALLVASCGVTLFVFYWQESGLDVASFQEQVAPRADRLMPSFIAHELPAGVSGLMLAALLAAAMSSLSSGINSTSGVFMTDYVQRLKLLPAYTKGLILDKLFSFSSGILGIGMAILIAFTAERTTWNLFELTGRINHLFVGPIAVLFFGGMLYRRAGRRGVLMGFLMGTVVSILICFGKELFFLEKGVSFIWVVPASFLIGMAVVGVMSLFSAPPSRNVDELTLHGLFK